MVRPPSAVPTMTEPAHSGEAEVVSNPRTTAPSRARSRPEAADQQRPQQLGAGGERAPVIRSKIQPPPLRSSTLSRQRLLDRLSDAVESRLTLIVAEAGYGKTTLLADFSARAPLRCLWYKLDPTDADPVTWTNYLIAAVREIDPEFGQRTLSLLSQVASGGPPESVFVASLMGELPDLGEAPTLLVLDDFHLVDESTDAREFVARLIREAPPWLHFVIATRRRPNLDLARLAGMGELVEIRTDDLRFSREETERLFADGYGLPLEPDVLLDLDSRTRGWAASLQLFHGSTRGRGSAAVRALATSLSGASSPIYDFLAQEVLNNLPDDFEEFLVRASLLDRVLPSIVVALYAEESGPSDEGARRWVDQADGLGLLTRSSESSDSRLLHPLLRDFLVNELRQRHSASEVREMHQRVALVFAAADPLTACRHFLEAGDQAQAMRCLGASLILTMGTGQWGVASELIDRVDGMPADPAVAAIRARRLIAEGDLAGARVALSHVDIDASPPDARAVFRHATLSLGWRTGDRDLMFRTLRDVENDPETPRILRDIFQVFVDASSSGQASVPYAVLARRMELMSHQQAREGYSYFAAISLHNAALTMVTAGRLADAWRLGIAALRAFDEIPGIDNERYSTHAILALCAFEQGRVPTAEEHMRVALSSGAEHGDVHAECAYALAVLGEQARATQLLLTASDLERAGKSDVTGAMISTFTRCLLRATSQPTEALQELEAIPLVMPLDTGYDLDRSVLTALLLLALNRSDDARAVADTARITARERGARRSEARLELIVAMAQADGDVLRTALTDAASVGEMAILAMADLLGRYLWLVSESSPEIRQSVARWPRRWLPILRRQLETGRSPNAFAAATLLDEYGELSDVGRLRAFAKTYRRTTRTSWALGRQLARKLSPILVVRDLGRSSINVGGRSVGLGEMRRKPASLVMFLITRPGFTATREQVIDELWPDSDPSGAANNLNQSLYFLRRDIDPWYEDDISADYIGFQADVVWLDPDLVRVASAQFVGDVRRVMGTPIASREILDLMDEYAGQFSPEFEYDEWAMSWRSRVHAIYLQFASWALEHLVSIADLASARDVAISALDRDPSAFDIERKLVWLFWQLGSRSASRAQFHHLTAQERADELDLSAFDELVLSVGLPRE